MRLPKSEVVAEEKHSGLWMPLYSRGGIEIKRLAQELSIARDVRRVRGCAPEQDQYDERDAPHCDTTPASPPEISDATFVRILSLSCAWSRATRRRCV